MKTKIALLSLTAVLVGFLVTGVAIQYQKYKQEQAQVSQEQKIKAEAVTTENKVEINSLNARVNVLLAECQKGVSAHGLLPLATREKTVKPDCGVIPVN